MSLTSWLKHAFAVETEFPLLSDKEVKMVERVSIEVVRRQMTAPAITFLEMARPLNYLGAQTLQFFLPMVAAVADAGEYAMFAAFLERRDSVDILSKAIELAERNASPIRSPQTEKSSEAER